MKLLAFFLAFNLTTIPTFASEMWVTTSNLSSQDQLEKLAETQRSKVKGMDIDSFYDVEMRLPVSQAKLSELFSLENTARSKAIEGDFATALKQYINLLEKLKEVPNVSGIEKITFSTFLHVAELETLLHRAKAGLSWSQAHAWSPHESPSSKEFSPATLKKFATTVGFHSALVEIKAPEEAAVFIDGRHLDQDTDGETYKIHLEPGAHQVAALAGGASWMFKNFDLKKGQLLALSLNPQPLVGGTCERPQVIEKSLPKDVRLFADFGNGCQAVYFRKKWFDVAGALIPMEALTPSPSPTVNSIAAMEVAKPMNEENTWRKTIKSPWFWTGVGIVAAGIVLAVSQNQPQPTVVPSHNFQ